MNYKILFCFCFIFLISCTNQSKEINYSKKFNNYSNKGFALIYDKELFKNKFVDKKLDNKSLLIFNNVLEKETLVLITNLLNGKNLVAKVSKNANFPVFYNSVISERIARDLEIDLNEPYIQIRTVNLKNSFIASKAKTFNEEKKVANKVPVKEISIKNISLDSKYSKKKNTHKLVNKNNNFSYNLKIADLYFKESANTLINRLNDEFNIKDIKIKRMSKNRYRVYKGPFKNLDSLKKAYNDIVKLKFENIEIIKL